jgi:hypothetical protein
VSEGHDWDAIEAEIRANGFLAAGADKFREHFRDVMAEWFDLAERLNALGQRMYIGCSNLLPGKKLTNPTSLGLQMMPRCLSGFQGALLILAERGLGVEAQALVRSVFETAFWIGYLSSDSANAVPQVRRETLKSEIGLFEASLEHLAGIGSDMRIPGSSRSVFRDDGDRRSEVMAISIPTSSRSAFRDDRDQMRVVLAV